MKTLSKQVMAVVLLLCATTSGYLIFYKGAVGEQNKKEVKYQTPDEAWVKRVETLRYKPSAEEEEVTKMLLWMSYLTDKEVTTWLKQLNVDWYAPLFHYEPTWPRCQGGIRQYLDLNPRPPSRDGVGEKLRPYVFIDGKKAEVVDAGLVDITPSIPWSGVWYLDWLNKEVQKRFNLYVNWFRHPDALEKVQFIGEMYKWPTGEEASYAQVHGFYIAAIIRYAIKHGSFSGPIIGDDSFIIVGSWFGAQKPKYSEFKPAWLCFRKYNFRVKINVMPATDKLEPATNEEQMMVEKVARFVEAQIIAYSLFGLEKFTILRTKIGDEEFYLPAGRISEGNYLMPVRYVLERLTEKRPNYDANLKQMRAEVRGKEEIVKGEVIEAANKYFQIPEEERLVANWEKIQSLLGLRKVKDIRFEQ